ncbi:MAG: ABC transporter substrate binding protein [Phycisphaerae bacterium]
MNADIRDSARRQWARTALVAGVCCALAVPGAPQDTQSARQRVAVVYGEKSPYQSAADSLLTTLRAAGVECLAVELTGGDPDARTRALATVRDFRPDVLATGGPTATSVVLSEIQTIPVVFFMVPNAQDAPFLAPDFADRARVTGVSSDVDPATQVEWLAATSPDSHRIAVLCSSRSQKTVEALREAARQRNLTVQPLPASRDAFPRAIDELHESGCDGVLMIPDADVYDSPSVQRLLLWGARQRKPVWTFSENVVKAGAFAGLAARSDAVGREAAQLVRDVLSGKTPVSLGLRYPQSVDKVVNVHTAEMIGVRLSDRLLRSGVRKVGGRP